MRIRMDHFDNRETGRIAVDRENGQKTALLHYWLVAMRGGERVFEQLCRDRLSAEITRHPIRESMIARFPGGRRFCQCCLPLMPAAQKRWDFSEYELLFSSESGPVKGVRKPAGCRHICYCHTPMRYVWDLYDEYYRNASLPGRLAMRLFRDRLRRYDLESAECVDRFILRRISASSGLRRRWSAVISCWPGS